MSASLQIVVLGILFPGLVAYGIARLWPRVTSQLDSPYAMAVAFAASFVASYCVLPDWAPLVPDRHWHWLPWLACVAAAVGPLATTSVFRGHRAWIVFASLAVGSALLLIPKWESLRPSRDVWIIATILGLALMTGMLDRVAIRYPSRPFLGWLAGMALAVAIVLAACVSLNYARVALCAAAGLVGCWLARGRGEGTRAIRGLLPAYSVAVGGIALVGCLQPTTPLWAILGLPVAPALLLSLPADPTGSRRGWKAWLIVHVPVFLFLAVVATWLTSSMWPIAAHDDW
ncbi:MAG TPA: hypothetical protein VIY86_10205 [Pirellulaceae bacterium]